jgi:hypothetical protein
MQQIADWLEKLGMSEYAGLFAENRIDLSVLPDLTDQDLDKLGIVLGDRRKMLRAIASLDDKSPGVTPEPVLSPVQATAAAPAAAEAVGERRYLTVMFCDLWAQLASPHNWMPRNGAIWSLPILMRPQRQ